MHVNLNPIPKECQSVGVWSEEQRWTFWLEKKQCLLENAPIQACRDDNSYLDSICESGISSVLPSEPVCPGGNALTQAFMAPHSWHRLNTCLRWVSVLEWEAAETQSARGSPNGSTLAALETLAAGISDSRLSTMLDSIISKRSLWSFSRSSPAAVTEFLQPRTRGRAHW